MVDLLFSAGRIALALVLVGLNGFFVAAEFAYVRVRSTAVESMVEADKPGASLLQEAMENLDDYLAVTQLGITIASLGLGWIGEPAVASLISPVAGALLPERLVHLVAFAIGFSVITFLHVVFGELAPKTIAIAQAEQIALFVAAPMKAFYYLFRPGIIVFNGTANAFTRLIGVPPASETDETLTEEEIRMVLSRSGDEGHVDAEEVHMIERVFELDDVTAGEVMIPRPDVRTIRSDRSYADVRSAIIEAGHTRYPVVESDDPNRVIGLVDAKDVLRAGSVLEGDHPPDRVTAADLARDLPAFPEQTTISDLLSDMQRHRAQMAVIIDEWGSFAGIVTVEDVVEELVGDIHDAFDVPAREPSIERREDGSLAIDGGVPLSTIEDALGEAFEDETIRTIGGLVLARLGRPPKEGDTIAVGDYEVAVTTVEGMRVSAVVVRETEAPEDDPNDE
ncbi:MAG: hemolysin family protein [Halobacteriota archaeon]